jgi:hypothetical protein
MATAKKSPSALPVSRVAPARQRKTVASKPVAKKAGQPTASKPAGTAAPAPVAPKVKTKLVRDSFTIPKSEYAALESLKDRGLSLARTVKKSELLRAGIVALSSMNDKAFLEAISAIPSLKTGRPKHAKVADGNGPVKKG